MLLLLFVATWAATPFSVSGKVTEKGTDAPLAGAVVGLEGQWAVTGEDGRFLIKSVQSAMAEGDIMKALEACEKEPSPMARVLASAFQHVEEGFDVIQQAVDAAADLETERLMQRLTWISVCSNLAPSLGLLGTVEGMILCFATLASGTPDIGALAGNISQALYTTAGGLVVSIPALTFFYSLRNNAMRLILRMSALTMELIKDLRNVEVDGEGAEG